MRLAIIRQRYTPYGGAERFVENALEALLERNVAITLYTRQWPQTRLQLIEPVRPTLGDGVVAHSPTYGISCRLTPVAAGERHLRGGAKR